MLTLIRDEGPASQSADVQAPVLLARGLWCLPLTSEDFGIWVLVPRHKGL